MTATEPKIDFTTIEFPSDKLTVKMLRQASPEATDVDLAADHSGIVGDPRSYRRLSLDDVLGNGVIDVERILAERAFKVALGQPVKDNYFFNKDDMIDALADVYTRYGLARGEHEVAAMIRRIEVQAEAQARQHGAQQLG